MANIEFWYYGLRSREHHCRIISDIELRGLGGAVPRPIIK